MKVFLLIFCVHLTTATTTTSLSIFNYFYIDTASTGNNTATKLETNLSESKSIHFRKCCQSDELIWIDSQNKSFHCGFSNGESWSPTLYSKPEQVAEGNASVSFESVGFPTCNYTLLDNRIDIWFNLLTSGSVVVGLNFWTIPIWLEPTREYCVDSVSLWNLSGDPDPGDINNQRNYALVFCQLQKFNLYLAIRLLFGCLFMISALSFLIIMIIYLLIWDHHCIHGWTQFSFFASFLMYFAMEGSRIFAKLNGLHIQPTRACFIHALVAHYFTIALSGTSCTMSMDCFFTFWKLRSTRNRSRRELFLYLFAAWGIPFITFAVGLHLHFTNNPTKAEQEISGVFEYAHYRCSSPIWELAFRVQLLLLLVNVVVFIATGCLIVRHFRSTAIANPTLSDYTWRQFKKSSMLFLKLFSIMGVGWLVSAIDIFFGYENPTGVGFILVRMYTSLQGFVFLGIFGLHRKNFRLIQRKYPKLEGLSGIFCVRKGANQREVYSLPRTRSTSNYSLHAIRERLSSVSKRIRTTNA